MVVPGGRWFGTLFRAGEVRFVVLSVGLLR
jgi:hypothetical protein